MTTWALDLDGVLWTGKLPIPGSAEAVSRLLDRGHEVVFVTNNSFATVGEQEAKLAAMGIDAPGRFISSAMAGATLVEPDERVFVLGGPGIAEAVSARGAHLIEDTTSSPDGVDAVLVGLDWHLSYDRLRFAVQSVAGGARFIATNTDPTYPTENGFYPGAGAIVASVAAATGQQPIIAGKPHEPQADLVRARFGSDGIMVGDRPETDGAFAVALGYRFGLVLSGVVSASDLPVEPTPDVVADDLGSLVATLDDNA
ncbi:MAG: HAD-IIA family hydrolase [Acidimicrobiales bacterium]